MSEFEQERSAGEAWQTVIQFRCIPMYGRSLPRMSESGLGACLEPGLDRIEPVSVPEAAYRLGLTEDALRKRIRRGEIRAKKVGKSWRVFLDGSENGTRLGTNQQRITENRLADKEQLIAQLQSEVVFLREQLTQQIATKEQQLAEKDQQLKELLSDNAAWREQVRYKELQLARLQDRVIELPSPEEAEPTEQEPELSQPGESGNVLRRFWHYLLRGE